MTLTLLDQMINSAIQRGFAVTKLADAAGFPIIALEKNHSADLPTIFLSSGIHGDEPAAVFAMRDLLNSELFADQANWRICPILNPSGFQRGTRENSRGIDLNRDFKNPQSEEIIAYLDWIEQQPAPALSIALHEDWESTGFYLYQIFDQDSDKSLARKILKKVSRIGPIEDATEIDGQSADSGLIEPYEGTRAVDSLEGWPEAVYLFEKSPHLHYTIESPSALHIELRTRMQIAAVKEAIRPFSKPKVAAST